MTNYHATVFGKEAITSEEEIELQNRKDQWASELIAIKSNKARTSRNNLLQQSDWTQILDTTLTDEQKTAWQTYRQALRDITLHENFPDLAENDWPTKP